MPLFIDVHRLPGVRPEDVAKAHEADLHGQVKHGVKYIKYWFNESMGTVFCMCTAPTKEAAEAVHRESHGLVPEDIIEVQARDVAGFLGEVPEVDSGPAMVTEDGNSRLDGGFRTVLFTDIAGSTELTQRLGDRGAMHLLSLHDTAVRGCLSYWNGREIKHTGDGIMACFISASQAVGCAIQVQQALHAHNAAHPDAALAVRIGLSAGEPVEQSNDLFGVTVQLAARVCNHAAPRQILVANVVAELCAGKDYTFEAVGDV